MAIDPNRPVKVICTGTPNPFAMRQLEDYLIDRAIEREAMAALKAKQKKFHWVANRAPVVRPS